ncbi:hypothetical protein ABZX90_08420 [Streptomyces sp. NPDC002935]|uniref:hypothetical protein n=1 Tax=Streptomyces sp. NPDC002935 TaxID=3154545 RepID=UPI0033B5011D
MHDAEDGTSTPMPLARSRHASVRSLERYARPGVNSVARHVAERDPPHVAAHDPRRLRLVTILLAYSVPGGASGSLAGAAAAVLAFPVEGGVGNVDVVEAVTDGASPHD